LVAVSTCLFSFLCATAIAMLDKNAENKGK
jgi:hypothetical protein